MGRGCHRSCAMSRRPRLRSRREHTAVRRPARRRHRRALAGARIAAGRHARRPGALVARGPSWCRGSPAARRTSSPCCPCSRTRASAHWPSTSSASTSRPAPTCPPTTTSTCSPPTSPRSSTRPRAAEAAQAPAPRRPLVRRPGGPGGRRRRPGAPGLAHAAVHGSRRPARGAVGGPAQPRRRPRRARPRHDLAHHAGDGAGRGRRRRRRRRSPRSSRTDGTPTIRSSCGRSPST